MLPPGTFARLRGQKPPLRKGNVVYAAGRTLPVVALVSRFVAAALPVVAGYASTQGGDLEMHGSFGSDGHAVAWLLAAPTTTLQLHISAPYQDNGVTVVSLWWTAPPGATSFSLTVQESTGIGPYSYTATALPQSSPSQPFIVQVEGATALLNATFQVADNLGDASNTASYP